MAEECRQQQQAARGSSELATPETAGPVSSLGVVGGSLPVSSAEDFALWLTHMIDLYTQLSEAEFLRGNTHEELKMGNYAVAFRTALTRFRRHMADANVRQPEENAKVCHGPAGPLA